MSIITKSSYEVQQLATARQNNRGKWEQVASYLGRYYGEEGNDLGEIPISIAEVTSEDDDGESVSLGWVVAETPEETTEYHAAYSTEDEARAAAEALAVELDETPDTGDVIAKIEATGYFAEASIIPYVIKNATEHSQGYLLITPDIGQPVGTRWTTNGYLQVAHIRLDATYGTRAEAAEALLAAIESAQAE